MSYRLSVFYWNILLITQQAEEVVSAIKIAKAFDVPLSTRGGGHGYTCQGSKSGMIIYIYELKWMVL